MPRSKIFFFTLALIIVGITAIYGMSAIIIGAAPTVAERPETESPAASVPVHSAIGVINSISEDGFSVRIRGLGSAKDEVVERKIIINADTSIAALVPLSGEELKKARETFMKDAASRESGSVPPVYKKADLSLGDLRLTMEVQLSSPDDLRKDLPARAEKVTFYAPPSTPPLAIK